MTGGKLHGTVAVVAVPDPPQLARTLVAEGATVILTGPPSEEIGALARELDGGLGRVAYFDGDPDALVEFISEQFKSAQQFNERPPVS